MFMTLLIATVILVKYFQKCVTSHCEITLLIILFILRNAPSDHHCVNTKCRDPMAIYFTSGTTGSPKMAEHSHCSYGVGLTVNARCRYHFESDIFL